MTGHPLQPTITESLADALGLPKNTIGFNLRFRIDRIPTITVQYYPESLVVGVNDDIISAIRRYELREIGEPTYSGVALAAPGKAIGVPTCGYPFLIIKYGLWDFCSIQIWGWGIRWRRGRSGWKQIRTKPISDGLDFGRWSISWLVPEGWAK